ncbi:MAG: integrase arm-type DNA-binding domain-containing protein [Methylobacterium sp.]|uniref:tyrosine-type recombinase/integrase n=1 Tax=Methylobacterium sp. TaxID=409 RepID=UPI0027263049|nr:site-specific integrase [Methylobacterium sp.]MDO9427357.1 integrase arm-type DNA-binding domain-containing protein [Methylobacterium sp.]
MRLTKTSVESLSLPAGKGELYAWDDTLTGFGVKLNRGGSRNFLIQYRAADGKTRRVVVGRVGTLTLDEARRRARELLVEVQSGGDPHADKAAAKAGGGVTLGSVVDLYLRQAAGRLKPRSFEQVERHLRRDWAPLVALPVNVVKRADVAVQLTALAADGYGVKANRARSALSALYTWAMGEGIADQNPVIGSNKPAVERSRERVLSEDEVRAVWFACRDDAYSRIVRLLLLTGQRRDEVGSIADTELDLNRAVWTIPGERTKNGVTHEVPLSTLALDTLAGQDRIAGRALVFGAGTGAFSGWSNSKERLDKRIAASGFAMPPWRLHDLRRTAATMMADQLAVAPHVVEAILNHVSGHRAGVAGIYNRAAYRAEKRDALERWSAFVLSLG